MKNNSTNFLLGIKMNYHISMYLYYEHVNTVNSRYVESMWTRKFSST